MKQLKLKGYASCIKNNDENINETEVEFDTIDRLLKNNEISEINELKMDIEGAEVKAIKGSQEILENSKNIVLKIAAYHKLDSGLKSYELLLPLLNSWGFNVRREYLPMIFGRKNAY